MATLGGVIKRGTAANRPAANAVAVGTLYFSTDTGVTERSNGSSWESYSSTAAIVTTGTYASRPAAAADGKIYLPTDGYALYRDTGAAWVPFGPIFSLTDPLLQTWSWVNQSTATIDVTKGGVYLEHPGSVASQIHLRTKSAPATPYTITALFIPNQTYQTFTVVGIGWRQSSDGKLVNLGWVANSASVFTLALSKWNTATSFSADYTLSPTSSVVWGSAAHQIRPMWMQISDNGTNRIARVSNDGQHWRQIHSVGRTDFLTADQVHFFVGGDATGASAQGMWLLSWKEE